jgi:hypothetical protein
MFVTSLESMEEIVKKNKFLSWDGWIVVHSYPSDKARTSKYGVYEKKVWQMQRRITPDMNGWDIPTKLMR